MELAGGLERFVERRERLGARDRARTRGPLLARRARASRPRAHPFVAGRLPTWARPNPESVTRGPARRRTQRKEAVSRQERLFHRLEMSTAQRFRSSRATRARSAPHPGGARGGRGAARVLRRAHRDPRARGDARWNRAPASRDRPGRRLRAGVPPAAAVGPPSSRPLPGPTRGRARGAPRASCSRAWAFAARSGGVVARPGPARHRRAASLASWRSLPCLRRSIGDARGSLLRALRASGQSLAEAPAAGGRAARRWWSVRRRPSRRSPSRKPTRWP